MHARPAPHAACPARCTPHSLPSFHHHRQVQRRGKAIPWTLFIQDLWRYRTLRFTPSTSRRATPCTSLGGGGMSLTPSKTKEPQASAGAGAGALTDSQAAGISSTGKVDESIGSPSEQAKTDDSDEAGEQPVSPFMLPIELLVDIFRHLDTTEVARSAQVSRDWQVIGKDARLWRHLSFSKTKFSDSLARGAQLQLLAQLKSIGARCGNTVESIDFGDLCDTQIAPLTEGLMASAPSLKRILWSTKGDSVQSLRAVAELAKRCPKLETLELRTWDTYDIDELFSNTPCVAKPLHCSLYAASIMERDWSFVLSHDQATLFDHATTLEFEVSNPTICESITVCQLAFLFQRNPAIEKLTVHGFAASPSDCFISAPSLTHLDLRWSMELYESLQQLDAPNLQELAIDAHLLPKLTAASTSSLSSLTLRIVGGEGRAVTEATAIERVKEFQGSLKLSVGNTLTSAAMSGLSHDYIWPGLEEVAADVTGASITALISILVARTAGARGASEEQYLALLSEAAARLDQAILLNPRGDFGAGVVREAKLLVAMASAFQFKAGTSPLCSQVQWLITAHAPRSHHSLGKPPHVPESILVWLKEQPNINITWPSSA